MGRGFKLSTVQVPASKLFPFQLIIANITYGVSQSKPQFNNNISFFDKEK